MAQTSCVDRPPAELRNRQYVDGTRFDLYNRVLFLDLMQQAIALSRHSLHPLALLYLDIDNFKLINDTFGHETGDRLLVAVAQRLSAGVRKTIDTVARLSGDEFAILQTGLNDPQAALSLARKLLHSISQPFVLEGRKIQTGGRLWFSLWSAMRKPGTSRSVR